MSAAKSWIVKTGFGTRLGPMPDDALRKLVLTGALLRSDKVSEGDAGEWRTASEIPGLFEPESSLIPVRKVDRTPASRESHDAESVTNIPVSPTLPAGLIPPIPATSPPLNLTTTELASSTTDSDAFDLQTPIRSTIDPSEFGGEALQPIVKELVVVPPVTPESELIDAWKTNRSRSIKDLEMVSLADEIARDEVVDDFAPELPSNLFDDDASTVPEETAPANIEATGIKTSRPSLNRPAFLDQVAGLEAGPRQPVESTRQKWNRWRRSMPSGSVAVVLILAIIGAWWLWPRSQRAIYNRYVALWSEWKQRRGDFKDKEGWEDFLRRTDAELNKTVPWLEKNTRAHDQEKLLLLFIGRDCFKILRKNPRQQNKSLESQLESLFAQVHELYGLSAPTVPRDAFIGANSVPPKTIAPQSVTNDQTTGVIPVATDPAEHPAEPQGSERKAINENKSP